MEDRVRTRLALACIACIAAVEASAQTSPPQDVARGVTVLTRPREELDPQGVRIGSFRLDASAAGALGYDSNIYGNNANRQGSGFWDTLLAASLNSQWTTHALSVTGSLTDRQYFDQSDLSWLDWNVGVAGRYDFSGSANMSAGYQHQRSHLSVSNVDVQQAGIFRQVPYSVDEFRLGSQVGLNRVTLNAELNYRIFRYSDVGQYATIPGATAPNTTLLDFNSWAAGLSAAYELAPGRSVLVTGRFQDVQYTDSGAGDRNSTTWAVLGGFRYDFDGIWQAAAAAGFLQRNFNGGQFKTINVPLLEAQVFYNPTRLTTLSLAVRRGVNESIRSDTASYVFTYVRLGVDHELRRDIILSAAALYLRTDYNQPSQYADDGVLQVGAQWFLNRSVSIGATYQYTNRFNRSGSVVGFDQNYGLLRLRLAM